MPPKRPAQLRPVLLHGLNMFGQIALLAESQNLLMDALRGRGITDLDEAGSLALQEYGTAYTIASGVITLTITGRGGQDTAVPSSITVDTEGAAATDNLDTISGGRDGMLLYLMAASDARTVVLKMGTGNLRLQSDFSLDNQYDLIVLQYRKSQWCEVSRADNGA